MFEFATVFEVFGEQLLAQKGRNQDGLYMIEFSIYAGEDFDVVDLSVPFPSKEDRDLAWDDIEQAQAEHFYRTLQQQCIAQKELLGQSNKS